MTFLFHALLREPRPQFLPASFYTKHRTLLLMRLPIDDVLPSVSELVPVYVRRRREATNVHLVGRPGSVWN